MGISTLSSPNSLGPYSTTSQPFKVSTTQAYAGFEKTFIDITTQEGDSITLQRSTGHTEFSQGVQWQDNASLGMAFSGQSIDSHSFSYTVQGDLSAEELKDLGELFDALSFIADDFFQGNLDDAVAGALNIGDLGSLSSLSATFSKTEISVSQSSSQHPYVKADLARADQEEQALARHRQGQWQQILSYLEKNRPEFNHPEKKDASQIKDHGQDIMARIEKAIEHHQRLAPLIYKLAEKAIADKQQDYNSNNPVKESPGLPAEIDPEFKNMAGKSVRV